jgi:hypothetical protein
MGRNEIEMWFADELYPTRQDKEAIRNYELPDEASIVSSPAAHVLRPQKQFSSWSYVFKSYNLWSAAS